MFWDNSLSEEQKAYKLDYIGAAIIGIATILAASSAYFSALWGGNMSQKYTGAVTNLTEASTLYLEGLSDLSTQEFRDFQDGIMYAQFRDADDKRDIELADLYKSYFSEPFRKTVEVDDYGGDFEAVNAAYQAANDSIVNECHARLDSATVLWSASYGLINQGDEANANGDDFTLATVLFTVVLFFAGMSAAARRYHLKLIYMLFCSVTFLGSTIFMLTLPFP